MTAPWPGPPGVPLVEGGRGGVGGEDPGQVVRDGHPDPHGRAVRVAGQVHETAEADADPVEAGPRRVGAVLAEAADAHGDQPVGQGVGGDVPLLERPRAEVLDQDVGGLGQAAEQGLAVGLAQVEGHALAAPALDGPEQRVAVVERADLAHEVARPGLLDLDDLGPLLAQQAGAERGRDPGPEVEDPQPVEWPAHAGRGSRGRPRTRSPMMLRWISFVPANTEAAW